MAYYAPSNNSPQNSPADLIRTLRNQGMDNNQIIQTLQRQGLSSNVIFEAMNEVDSAPMNSQTAQFEYPTPNYQEQAPMQNDAPMRSAKPQMQQGTSDEELIEAIIEEKWTALVKDLDKVIDWKNSANNKIITMEQKIEDMRREFDKLHTAIISKIDDYDKNISNVGAEVKAMEKAFSKVLPVFAENVAELSRISKDLKTGPKK